jgi:hypothetical protein
MFVDRKGKYFSIEYKVADGCRHILLRVGKGLETHCTQKGSGLKT